MIEKEIKYKIAVKTLQGLILSFSVNDYEINDNMISFTDLRTGKHKMFSINNIEIEVLKDV
jgi:hypothetical protein